MKKRLFSISILSVLIIGIMAFGAFAADAEKTAKPEFTTKAADVKDSLAAIPYKTAMTSSVVINVKSDTADLTLTTDYAEKNGNTIGGVTVTPAVAADKLSGTVTIASTSGATEVVKGKSVTITAKNKTGTSTMKIKLGVNPGDNTVTITAPTGGTKITGNVKKDTALAEETWTAAPGPVVWKVKNLPKGLTATEKDGALVIKGKFSTVTAFDATIGGEPKKSEYEITAQNKAISGEGGTGKYEGECIVYDKPDIKTTKLPDMTLGKPYKAKLDFVNYPSEVTVKFGDSETGATNAGPWNPTADGSAKCAASDEDGLTWDEENRTITGKWTRLPGGSKKVVYVKIETKDHASTAAAGGTKTLPITIKPVAPSWQKPETNDLSSAITVGIPEGKGTPPFTVTAYIDANTAKALGASAAITLGSTADTKSGLKWTPDTTVADGYVYSGKLEYAGTGTDVAQAFKGLKVTFSATNAATTKAVEKAFGFDYNTDADATWQSGTTPKDVEEPITINAVDGTYTETYASPALPLPAGTALNTAFTTAATFKVNVPRPVVITGADKPINGLKATATTTNGATSVAISGTPTKGKDTTTKFKLVATNPLSKHKATLNLTIQAYAEPEIANKTDLAKGKPVVAGKAVSIKSKVKAHKDLLPLITYTGPTTATDLTDPGLTLESDTTKGTFEIKGEAGATKPTLDTQKTKYTSKDIEITMKYPYSANTSATGVKVPVKLNITPLVPKFATTKLTIDTKKTGNPTTTTNNGETYTDANPYIDFSNITKEMTPATGASAKLSYEGIGTGESLPDGVAIAVGATAGTDAHKLKLTLTPANLKAGKYNVTVAVKNYGTSEAKKKVTFQINDPKPVIKKPTATFTALAPSQTADASANVVFEFDTTNSALTGDSDLKWKISTKPEGLKAKIEKSSTNKSQCTIKITAPKKLAEDVSTSIGMQAQNTVSKEWSEEVTYDLSAKAAPTTDGATKDGEALATDRATDEATPVTEEEVEVGEGEVILGKARTEAALTAGQRTAIAEAGYIVAAVLPEVEVTAAGQYPFAVEIPEEIAAGKELAWFAFPTKPSEDDEIVDFFDDEGKDTDVVPESHKITVYPWLNADVTYAPVIAVKADTGEEGSETEEQIKERTVRAVKK